MWAQILPRIKVNEQVVLRSVGLTGWAIRKESPKLAAEIYEFFTNILQKQGVMNYRMQQRHVTFSSCGVTPWSERGEA